jgi:hypothetical protein
LTAVFVVVGVGVVVVFFELLVFGLRVCFLGVAVGFWAAGLVFGCWFLLGALGAFVQQGTGPGTLVACGFLCQQRPAGELRSK